EFNGELRDRYEGKSLDELTEILKTYKTLHNTTDIDTRARALRAIEIQEYYRSHPEAAAAASRTSATPLRSLVIGVDIPREERRRRITQRLEARLDEGMIDEIRTLLKDGVDPESLIYYGLEYKFVTLHVLGRLTLAEMRSQLETAIHQFAKRQMTWFRGMERRGIRIHWLPYDMGDDDFVAAVEALDKVFFHGNIQ
ncbi:MAG: tRNA (adenosine(37)-N6)-dimethylallyltransferase MiaA, partial [Muribaculaceae bacterium]|nr:tRNA (adenosine(37)-N6)-dimethylallyltransferase MiaA [Muribaculaceae bacterium]